MDQGNRFGEFISNLRKEKQISLEQLSDGLCAVSMLSRFEHGEREPEKLMQNRFLTRLGAVPENYENFLFYEDYCRWEKRQGILHNILEENIEEAKRLLEKYHQEYDMENVLEEQFYLAMLAQIMRYEGCGKAELAVVFKEALELTVPEMERRGIWNRVLSLEELNLLLEYVHCSNFELSRYEELLKYIESMERTMLALAKIYPKTVYYYYLAWEDAGHQGTDMALRMLELCDKAIEILRDANRMFYMWELFGVMERLVPMLPKETRESERVQTRLAECLGWKETLEEIYRDYGVSIAMYEFCYLYVGSENYCIGDVVRIRRKMLGLSQKRLCKNICDERTLGRLEKNETRPQREVVQYLFDRLNLSTELCRTVLVTDSQEAIEMYREINKQNNNWNFEQVEMLTKKLRKLVSLDIPSNKQALERNEVLNLYKQKIISKLDYIKKMKEVLENTVPYKAAIKNSEKYLTNEEIACLQNITLNIGWENAEMQECVMALVRICEMPKYPANYVRVYEFVMGMVSSYLGDKGEYDYSNRVKNNIVAMALKNRRIKAIDSAIYGMLWNREQESKKGDGKFEKKIHENELKKCIRMSSLCKSVYRMNIYERKIHEE